MRPWLDQWELVAGAEWQPGLAAGLAASSSCAVFIGHHHLGSWEQQEVSVAIDRAAKDRDFLLFLVLLPGVAEPFDPAALSPFLSMRTWVDLRRGWDSEHAIQPLVNAIKGVPLGPPTTSRAGEGAAPYRGLQVFEEENAEDFFGRDADVQRLLERLKAARFVAVVGASGSGKSSLVRAGLVPALRVGALPGSERWTVRVMMPGPRPLVSLAASLLSLTDRAAMQDTVNRLETDPRSLDLAVSLALADRKPEDRVLWIIDQAEELFTLCRDEHERRLFLENLLYAASVPDGANVVVLTMRGDFYAMFGRFPPVAQAIATQQILVGPMGPESLRKAIEEPARRVGVHFEDGLVATILHDVGSEPGGLPLLQEALLELWKRRRGNLLTLEAYQEAGRVEGAIAQRAESVLASLTPEQQEVARRVLLRLTQPGEGTEDTRRRAPLRELREDGRSDHLTDGVVAAFVEARMLVTSADPATNEPWVEVSHEALIRGWPRLRDWIDRDRAALRVHRRLTEAADDWERSGRDDSELYHGFRLAEAVDWLAADPTAANERERTFVAASTEARHRAAKRRRRRLALVAAGLTIGIVGVSVAVLIAIRQLNTTDQERAVAQSRALAAASRSQAARDPSLSFLLAVEAARRAHTSEAEDALRSALLQPQPRLITFGALTDAMPWFSPDGRLVLTVSGINGSARLWDARSGRRRADLPRPGLRRHPSYGTFRGAFSRSGRLIATANPNGAVIWNSAGKRLKKLYPGGATRPGASISLQPFSQDERHLVVTAGRPDVTVYDLVTGSSRMLSAPGARVTDAVFSPNGRLVAASTSRSKSRVWDVKTQQKVRDLRGTRPRFSRDGRHLLTFGYGKVSLWALSARRPIVTADAPAGTAAFDRDSRLVLIETRRGFASISAKDGSRVPLPPDGVRPIDEPTFSPDGRFIMDPSLLGAFANEPSRLRSTVTGETVARYPENIAKMDFSPDGASLVTGHPHRVQVWPTPPWNAVRVAGAADFLLAAGPRSWTIVTSKGGRERIWSGRLAPVGAGPPRSSPPLPGVRAISLSGDGSAAAVLRRDGHLQVWRGAPWRLFRSIPVKLPRDPEMPVAVSDGGRVVVLGRRPRMIAWDAATRREIGQHNNGSSGWEIVLSADGRMVATDGPEGIYLWDSHGGHTISKLKGTGPDTSLDGFSRDGRRFLTELRDTRALVSDTRSGGQVAVIHGRSTLTEAALSGDARLVAATEELHDQVRLWEAESGRVVGQLPLRTNGPVAFGGGNSVVTAAVPLHRDRRGAVVPFGNVTVRMFTCEACRPFDDLLRFALSRLPRALTPQERRQFRVP